MKKLKNKIGVTMAEMLMVVAIVVVLCGVAFIGVWAYQRSLGQLERDGIAKEIFVAAQNHLTVAFGEGYRGLKEPEKDSTESNPFGSVDTEGAYYFVVNGNIDENTVLGQMLPFGSIDETVRAGGSYIIRYQKETGTVLDVFYCTRSGSPSQFNHKLSEKDYTEVLKLKDTEVKSFKEERKDWEGEERDGAILGWYGGEEATTLPKITLENPTITVTNADKLSITVKDPNKAKYSEGAMLKLIIEGLSSGAKKAIALYDENGNASSKDDRITAVDIATDIETYTVVLDDITTKGCHFAELESDIIGKSFIPGENITIKAVSYSTTKLANIAYSSQNKTNSLFASLSDSNTVSDGILETAGISSIRHLENLDQVVSNLGEQTTATSTKLEKFKVASAVQTTNLDWDTFKTSTNTTNTKIYYLDGKSYSASACTGAGYYYPISPLYSLTYDGKNHSISNVAANSTKIAAGLFGSVPGSTVSKISNLELIDFSIQSKTSAGALAGTLEDCTVTNVLARNKDNSAASLAKKITGSVNAGGLIGKLISGTVKYSGAAVIVGDGTKKPTNAGGLIGEAAAGTISGCYSGGHTSEGSYKKWVETKDKSYDVIGGTAGGLVGKSAVNIRDSYSTCSVLGTTAAGFVASATGGSITNCYATGYIDPNTTTKFAFVASGTPVLSENYYYRVINEIRNDDKTEQMPPYAGATDISTQVGIKPIDLDADTYNTFVGNPDDWNIARAFDPTLVQYYSGKYPLKTVQELKSGVKPDGYENWNQLYVVVHYGDWPSPETFFINTK